MGAARSAARTARGQPNPRRAGGDGVADRNEVVVVGRLVTAPAVRELPSGDTPRVVPRGRPSTGEQPAPAGIAARRRAGVRRLSRATCARRSARGGRATWSRSAGSLRRRFWRTGGRAVERLGDRGRQGAPAGARVTGSGGSATVEGTQDEPGARLRSERRALAWHPDAFGRQVEDRLHRDRREQHRQALGPAGRAHRASHVVVIADRSSPATFHRSSSRTRWSTAVSRWRHCCGWSLAMSASTRVVVARPSSRAPRPAGATSSSWPGSQDRAASSASATSSARSTSKSPSARPVGLVERQAGDRAVDRPT